MADLVIAGDDSDDNKTLPPAAQQAAAARKKSPVDMMADLNIIAQRDTQWL